MRLQSELMQAAGLHSFASGYGRKIGVNEGASQVTIRGRRPKESTHHSDTRTPMSCTNRDHLFIQGHGGTSSCRWDSWIIVRDHVRVQAVA